MIDYDERWRRRFEATQRRQALKKRAVEYKGGKCALCSYDDPVGLCFHHEFPQDKEFEISSKMSWKVIQPELDKCILLCLNHHAEVHAGYHTEYLVGGDEARDFDDLGDLMGEDGHAGLAESFFNTSSNDEPQGTLLGETQPSQDDNSEQQNEISSHGILSEGYDIQEERESHPEECSTDAVAC